MTDLEKDKAYLNHIKESIEYIDVYLRGLDKARFEKDVGTREKVIRRFGTIGHAFNQTSDNFRKSHPEIDWREAIDMRNSTEH